MTQEEKQLLLQDICARLSYGIQIHIDFNEIGHIVGDATLDTITSITGQLFNFTDFEQDFKNGDCCPISGFGSHKLLYLEDFKPYLRPMSSMTEEESELFERLKNEVKNSDGTLFIANCNLLQRFFRSRHIDNNHLIESGLALEAPEEMYKI